MTPSDRAAARDALARGRATYTRLDQIRSPEDTAADVLDLWEAAQSAMRAMLGGSLLSGQALVRELGQRGVIELDHANALATFWDARSRVEHVNYTPTLTDVGHARSGYDALTRVLEAEASAGSIPPSPPPAVSDAPASADRAAPIVPPPEPVRRHRGLPLPALAGIVAVVLLAAGIAVYFMVGRLSYDKEMATGIGLMQSGAIEAAQVQFSQIARDNPTRAEPHVFMARLSRDVGDLVTATKQLDTAIHIDPSSAVAQREMGLLLLGKNEPDLARRFLVRAVQLAPADSAAQGYLGCALVRLHRDEEAQRFLSRAGPGSWSACASAAASAPTHQ